MNSHNAKSDRVVRRESIEIVADRDDVRVIKSDLIDAAELSISTNDDRGNDPYNRTGQHAVLKSRLDHLD